MLRQNTDGEEEGFEHFIIFRIFAHLKGLCLHKLGYRSDSDRQGGKTTCTYLCANPLKAVSEKRANLKYFYTTILNY